MVQEKPSAGWPASTELASPDHSDQAACLLLSAELSSWLAGWPVALLSCCLLRSPTAATVPVDHLVDLPRYQQLSYLSQGLYGHVLQARDLETNETVRCASMDAQLGLLCTIPCHQ